MSASGSRQPLMGSQDRSYTRFTPGSGSDAPYVRFSDAHSPLPQSNSDTTACPCHQQAGLSAGHGLAAVGSQLLIVGEQNVPIGGWASSFLPLMSVSAFDPYVGSAYESDATGKPFH